MKEILRLLNNNPRISPTDVGEFADKRCPKCGSTLLTSDGKVWCSFVGGRTEKACDYGIAESVTADDMQNND